MAQRFRRRGERGLTLLELIIVIGILVMLMGFGISGLGNMSSTQLRTQTNKMAAALRHTYSRSVATGLYMRMVLDLDADRYWVEASPTPVFLVREEDERMVEAIEKQKEDDAEEGVQRIETGPRFQADHVIPPVAMEKGIQIDSVQIAGQTYPISGGKAYVHFFPNGFAEPTIFYTSDGDGEYRTLLLNPLTGKVTHRGGKADPGREFGEPDKVEDEDR